MARHYRNPQRGSLLKGLALSLLCVCATASANIVITNKIIGLKNGVLENAQQRLIDQREQYPAEIDLGVARHIFLDAENEILEAIKPYGYFHGKVEASLKKEGDQWEATYTVNPGEQVKISEVTLTIHGPGAKDPKLMTLKQDFTIKPGQGLETEAYAEAKEDLLFVAINQGYLNAIIDDSRITIDIRDNTASILISLDTKKRHYFGPTSFDNHDLDADLLKRYAPFKVGQPFSRVKLTEFQENLSNSNYFAHVAARTIEDGGENIPINMQLIPHDAHQYTAGIGFDTDMGISTLFGMRLSRLTKTGHQFNTMVRASMKETELSAEYTMPAADPISSHYLIGVSYDSQIEQNFGDQDSLKLHGSYITKHENWHRALSLNLLDETSKPSSGAKYKSTLLYPEASWTKLLGENKTIHRKSGKVQLDLAGTAKPISTVSFAQGELSATNLLTLSDFWRLQMRGKLGLTVTNNFSALPLTMQFATGGSRSVRGYVYNDIGPGKILRVASAELQRNITGNWYMIGFMDAGRADNELTTALFKGLGTGVLYATPLGDAKLTFAKGIDSPGKPLRIQFSIDN